MNERETYSGMIQRVISKIESEFDIKNDPIAYRVRMSILHCRDESDVINVLLQAMKVYNEKLNVVNTQYPIDIRSEPISIMLSEEQYKQLLSQA